MKKIIATLVFVCVVAGGVFGQTSSGMLNLRSYASYFLYKDNLLDADYEVAVIDEDYYDIVAILGGNSPTLVDTPLEIALLSICAGVADIRPAEANRMLGNAKQADQKLGAAVFQEIQILRFLADTAAVNRHEAVLQFITGRGNATRAEIEKFYRDNVRSLIAAVVDEEFNKIRFMLNTDTDGCNVTMIRNGNQYSLICDGYWGTPKVSEVREFTGSSLDDLIRNMQASRNFRDQYSDVWGNTSPTYTYLRAQAALIPAVALSDAALDDVKTILTAFYTTPNATTYNAVKEMYALFIVTWARSGQRIFENIRSGCAITLSELNPALAKKVWDDANKVTSFTTLTRDQQQRLVGLR